MYNNNIKPVLDLLIAFALLLVLSPILLVSMAVITVSVRGNPFFVHARPGLNEKTIKLIKLKTMKPEKDHSGRVLGNRERITRLGSFFRRTSIDEIPQLFNVLKGDVSLVGPRPLQMWYLPHYTDEQRIRHSVRPGITGLAQVNGRNRLSWDEKFKLDRVYAENLSFWMDIKILLKTVVYVFNTNDICSGDADTMEAFVKNPLHADPEHR